jgi:Trk K+ transport system NAD-binding subunit
MYFLEIQQKLTLYQMQKLINADVLIALSDSDTDNYITCITAKKLFNIKKTVSKVRNPKNVELI